MSKPALASASAVATPSAESGAHYLQVVRRLLLAGGGLLFSLAVTFFGLLVITFVIGRLMPIDPVLSAVGDRASLQTYNAAKEAMGLNLPIWHQFARYAWNVLHGDLGTSILTARPVLEDLIRVFPATAEMATVAIIIGIVLGIPLGVWAAVYRNSVLDQVMRVVGLIGYSVPIFWLGIMGLLVFYLQLEWVGGPGRLDVFYDGEVPTVTGFILIDSIIADDWDVFTNAFSHIILPASLLGYYSLAYISRMTRSLMLEQLNQEYLITARVKGVPERRVIWRHAFGNIQVALITVCALAFANILEGSVLTETVFAWPGIGRYITTALASADMNAVLGGTIVVGTVYVGLNLLTDILYRVVDPRREMTSNDATLGQPIGLKAWLRSETPVSGWQAGCIRAYRGWRLFARNPMGLLGLAIVLLLFFCAAFAPWISTADPTVGDLNIRLQSSSADHWLGTDRMGRDTYSAVIYGARATLYIVVLVLIIAAPVGLIIGATAGFIGGWTDRVLMRITDIFFAFPRLVLALAFVASLGPGLNNAIIAIALTAWPAYARVARAETLAIRQSDFIAAIKTQGASNWRIIFRHIMPLSLPSVIVRATLDMAGIILTAAGLGFLGLGAQPPTPEWGAMISVGRENILDQWWVPAVPGAAIFIVSLGFNLLGDALRDVLDPKMT